MKKAIKNWLFKDELKELIALRDDLMNFPTHDQVDDVIENYVDNQSFVTESDVEEHLSEVVTEHELYHQLRSHNLVFQEDIEEFVADHEIRSLITEAVDKVKYTPEQLEEAVDEGVTSLFEIRAGDVVKAALKDIPGYFIYEQIKRYVEEDYVKWDHFSLNHDDLTAKVEEINEIVEHLEAFQAPGVDKVVFFANFKDAIRKLLEETELISDISPDNE